LKKEKAREEDEDSRNETQMTEGSNPGRGRLFISKMAMATIASSSNMSELLKIY